MFKETGRARRCALAALALTTLTLAGCSSSTTGGKGSSGPTSGGSSQPGTSSLPGGPSASGGSTSGSSSGGGGGSAAACADITSLMTINKEFDGIGSDIGKGKVLIVSLQGAAAKFAQDAPSGISAAAGAYSGAIATLKTYVDKATSINELHGKSSSDPKLKSALTSLSSSGSQIDTWRSANC